MRYNLSEICSYSKKKINIDSLSKDTYVSTENMLPNKGGITSASSLPSVEQTQAFLSGDVLVSNIRPYFKKIWFAKFDGGCSNDVLVFRAKDGVSQRFLYYVLSDDAFFDYSTATSKGTKMPRGDKAAIMEYEVPNFTYEKQEKIAGILEALDAKIQLNAEINNHLEKMLHEIFDDIFRNKPRSVPLGDVIRTTSGGTPTRKHSEYYLGGNIAWVKSKELLGGYITDTEEKISALGLKNSSAKMLPQNSVLIAMYGATVGSYGIISKPMTCNQAIRALICNDNYPYTYLYQLACESVDYLKNMSVGSAQQNISQVIIQQMPVHNDPICVERFHRIVRPIHEKLRELRIESNHLQELRDTLLPRLMSGELNVSDLDL